MKTLSVILEQISRVIVKRLDYYHYCYSSTVAIIPSDESMLWMIFITACLTLNSDSYLYCECVVESLNLKLHKKTQSIVSNSWFTFTICITIFWESSQLINWVPTLEFIIALDSPGPTGIGQGTLIFKSNNFVYRDRKW